MSMITITMKVMFTMINFLMIKKMIKILILIAMVKKKAIKTMVNVIIKKEEKEKI